MAVRLPDINLHISDRLPIGILDRADDEARLSIGIMSNNGTIRLIFSFVRVERTENGAFGAGGRLGVIYAVYEEREAEDVGEQNEFLIDNEREHARSTGRKMLLSYLSHIGAHLSNGCKEVDAFHPFLLAQSRFSGKIMDMLH